MKMNRIEICGGFFVRKRLRLRPIVKQKLTLFFSLSLSLSPLPLSCALRLRMAEALFAQFKAACDGSDVAAAQKLLVQLKVAFGINL